MNNLIIRHLIIKNKRNDSIENLIHGQILSYLMIHLPIFRDGPLFIIGGGGGVPLLGLADNFFLRIMRFKQFFHYIF